MPEAAGSLHGTLHTLELLHSKLLQDLDLGRGCCSAQGGSLHVGFICTNDSKRVVARLVPLACQQPGAAEKHLHVDTHARRRIQPLVYLPLGLHDAVRAQWHFRKVESEVMVVVADEGIEGINTVTAWCGAQGVHLGYNAIAAEAQGCGLILEALQPCLRTL